MADDQDQSQKPKSPTQKRLKDAREKGEVASSREVNHAFMILAGSILVVMILPGTFRDLALLLQQYISMAHEFSLTASSTPDLYRDLFLNLGAALAVPMGILIVFALAAGLVQNGFMMTPEAIKPKLSKISPLEGVKRLFSLKAIVEFVKGIAKLAIVGAAAVIILLPQLSDIELMPTLAVTTMMGDLKALSGQLFVGVFAIVAVIAGLDYLYQRQEFTKKMRMSRQELKDEFKQTEGDPMVKNRLRQIRTERARGRMMAAVPEADVVITNPTHFAVALAWDPEKMNAPKMVAKGADLIALKIREVADENDVPIVENPPLARALFGGMEIEQEIPVEHYKVVAEIISYVMGVKQGRGSRARR